MKFGKIFCGKLWALLITLTMHRLISIANTLLYQLEITTGRFFHTIKNSPALFFWASHFFVTNCTVTNEQHLNIQLNYSADTA